MVDVAMADGVGIDGKLRPSEDKVAVLDNAILLLDGATALLPGKRSGGWYSGKLIAELEAILAAEPSITLVSLLANGIAAVRDAHGLVAGDSPSSTVAMLRWSEDTVDGLVLADSPIVVRGPAGVDVLCDERLAQLPRGGGGYRDRLRSGGGYGGDHVAALRAGASRTSLWRNVDGGFWVAEADPAAARHAVTRSWPRTEVSEAMLASDGVSCAVDDYSLMDWPAALQLVATRGAAALLDLVRTAERADPDGKRWPRPKVSDDQALTYVDLTAR
jgi:hypothetical protein